MPNPLNPTEHLDSLLRSVWTLDLGLWDWDLESDRVWGSQKFCQQLGLNPESVLNIEAVLERAHPADYSRVSDALKRLTQDRRPLTTECRFWTSGSEHRTFEIRAEVSESSAGEATSVSGSLRDVHQERLREEDAEQRKSVFLQRQRVMAVDRLASGVAHEFNNVLQIIRGYATFARDSVGADSDVHEDLEEILYATDRAAALTKRLLEFSRAEDQEGELVDICEVLGSLHSLLTPVIDQSIDLHIAPGNESLTVTGVDGSLRQVLLNLCLNARDAMEGEGRLWVRAERFDSPSRRDDIGWGLAAGSYCRIWISDTGSGIPADRAERVFDPFFSTKEIGKGTGLGLAVVRGTVQRLRGSVTLHSVVDRGTSFVIYLPLSEEDGTLAMPGDPSAWGDQDLGLSGKSILIVEPNTPAVRAVEGCLDAAGMKVHRARDRGGAEKLRRVHGQFDFALIHSEMYEEVEQTLEGVVRERTLLGVGFDPHTTLWESPTGGSELRAVAAPYNARELIGALTAAVSEQYEPSLNSTVG